MSGYAVRNDGQGWRVVASLEDVMSDERYMLDTPPEPIPLPPDLAELRNLMKAKRDQILSVATHSMWSLQDAVDLNEATPDEAVMLKKWKQFRIALSRIEQQPTFPVGIVWPVSPEE